MGPIKIALQANSLIALEQKLEISKEVKKLLDRVIEGDLEEFGSDVEGSDFGFFIPTYTEDGVVKLMEDGKSQMETNLKITITDASKEVYKDAEIVAWMGNSVGKDSSCSHGGTTSCKHCTGHSSNCRHCTGHTKGLGGHHELVAPELVYPKALDELRTKENILNPLASRGFGLALLHGHNNQHKFTKLPIGTVSVIADGVTSFRPESDVASDPTFVPNTWRVINGALRVAGGFSEK